MTDYLKLYEVKDDNFEKYGSEVMTENDILDFASELEEKEIFDLKKAIKVIEGRDYTMYNLHQSFPDSFNEDDYLELFEVVKSSEREKFNSEILTEGGLLELASSFSENEETDLEDAIRIIEESTLDDYDVYSIQLSFPESLIKKDPMEDVLCDAIELEIVKNIDYDQELKDDLNAETGGISYVGETLRSFMEEVDLPIGQTTLSDINKALRECGILEISEK